MKKTVLIAYDLKSVRGGDNERVKAALLRFTNTISVINAHNELSPFLERIALALPDTTIFAVVEATTSAASIVAEVKRIIENEHAVPDKIYAGYIEDDCLWNREARSLSLAQSLGL